LTKVISIAEKVVALRSQLAGQGNRQQRAEQATYALKTMAKRWFQEIDNGWQPASETGFPWVQVRRSLERLLFDMVHLQPPMPTQSADSAKVLGLILAGNTPLLAYPAIVASLWAGQRVYVKYSRDETYWVPQFTAFLQDVSPEVAERIVGEVWEGSDPRTQELVEFVDIVIAYGSDGTIAQLRTLTPAETPFFGFGHAISLGIALRSGHPVGNLAPLRGFARDTLMYAQQGCLSPQAILLEGGREEADWFGRFLAEEMEREAIRLKVPAVREMGTAQAIRSACDIAQFAGATVYRDSALRYSLLVYPHTVSLPEPVGYGVLPIIPVENIASEWHTVTERYRGKISAVGVSGKLPEALESLLTDEGVTYICPAGQMQTPPLHWQNGGIDLFTTLQWL